MIRHFVNLTNGIEAIDDYLLRGHQIEFIRIASTDCEHKLGNPQWDAILAELDTAFLMALARGDQCIVYDYSTEGGHSHAQSHGLAWVYFALNVSWFGRYMKPINIDGQDMSPTFQRLWRRRITDRTKKKLRYFQKYLTTQEIRLSAQGGQTKHDGNWEYYLQVLRDAGC